MRRFWGLTDVGVSALREFHCAFGRDAWVMGQTDQDEVERESDHLYVLVPDIS